MNEIQIYSAIMFAAGVVLTHAVFYFDKKNKQKKFYIYMAAAILQVLDSIYSVHMAALEFAKQQIKTEEESVRDEYLEKEGQKVSLLMEVYVLLFIKAVPLEGRKHINFSTWSEATSLINKLRGLNQNGQNKR